MWNRGNCAPVQARQPRRIWVHKSYLYSKNNNINTTKQSTTSYVPNPLRPRQNVRLFGDNTFKCIFLDENVWIWIKISLKSVPDGPSSNIPALFQIMAWRRPGATPSSEPMMMRLPTHVCVTRPQWDNQSMGYTVWVKVWDNTLCVICCWTDNVCDILLVTIYSIYYTIVDRICCVIYC